MTELSHLSLALMSTCLCVAGTPYEGGMFRMKLVLPKDFPASPPQGTIVLYCYVHEFVCYATNGQLYGVNGMSWFIISLLHFF